MKIRMKITIILPLAIAFLASCSLIKSTNLSSPILQRSNQVKKLQIVKMSLENNKVCKVELLNDNNQLKVKIGNNTLVLGEIAVDMDEKVVMKVVKGEDKNYIAVYKYFLIGSASGEEDALYLMKYDTKGSIDLLWSGDLPDYKYKYKNNKIEITYTLLNKVIEGSINNIVKNMESQKERFAPLSVDELLNGKILTTLTDVGIQDYLDDNYTEIITKHDIYNEQLGMYLSSVYNVWKVKNNSAYIYRSFIIDVHNYEISVINEIVENGYINSDKLELLFDKDEGETDYINYISRLFQDGIIKENNSRITIN